MISPVFRIFNITALAAVTILIGGCDLFGSDDKCSGTANTVTSTKLLTPSDPGYELYGSSDAILSKACPVTFNLTFGFFLKDLQYIAYNTTEAVDMPLQNLKAKKVFHVDHDGVSFQEGWVLGNQTRASNGTADFKVAVTDHGNYTGSGDRGQFYIKTALLPSIHSADSSMWVVGTISYYH